MLVKDLIQRTFKVCDEALQQADVVGRDLDGVIMVGGPTRLPLIREAVSEYFQQELKSGVDPDEVVAMGAAIHAASLTNAKQEAYLLDVTPLSLRIGVAGGFAETVIERNTPVPIEQTRSFTTFKDFQESVEIRIFQGESREAAGNELLGQFVFSGFEKARRGAVEIDVTFEINADGIVDVRARDRATGQEASTRITLSAGLSETEIEQIIDNGRTDRMDAKADSRSDATDPIERPVPLEGPPAPEEAELVLSNDAGIQPTEDSAPELTDDSAIPGLVHGPSSDLDEIGDLLPDPGEEDDVDLDIEFDLQTLDEHDPIDGPTDPMLDGDEGGDLFEQPGSDLNADEDPEAT